MELCEQCRNPDQKGLCDCNPVHTCKTLNESIQDIVFETIFKKRSLVEYEPTIYYDELDY